MAPRLRRTAAALLGLAALAALAIFGFASSSTPQGGVKAPALPNERLAGPPISSVAGHHARLVVFWASWCGPCAHEAGAVERVSESALGRGRVIGVNWSDALSGARAFVRHYGWNFPNLRDAGGTVGNAYHLTGLPTTFAVDGQGRIRATLRGPQDEASLEQALARAEHS
jgi:cytochrome c biogenesis protein CcmG/thiol:disulfide interchange protein DsbE